LPSFSAVEVTSKTSSSTMARKILNELGIDGSSLIRSSDSGGLKT